MSTSKTFLEALQGLAPAFPQDITNHGFYIEIEGRQYLHVDIETDLATQDRIQGALQRLCIARGWFFRIKSIRRGSQARVSPGRAFSEPKQWQARGANCAHALALALLNVARYLPMEGPAEPERNPEIDALAYETWGAETQP